MIRFRAATRADVPAIVALLADDVLGAGRETGDMDRYFGAFDDIARDGGNEVIVGDRDGEVVATYQITYIPGLSLAAMRRAQVESVRVARAHRGQGIGRAMFADVEARAREARCGLVQLTMNADRTDSAQFYRGIGFEPSHVGWKRYLR